MKKLTRQDILIKEIASIAHKAYDGNEVKVQTVKKAVKEIIKKEIKEKLE
jgi:uncharacterized iron-regulated protein